jgi:hypothetical protein
MPLIIHAGASPVTYDDLRCVRTPDRTGRTYGHEIAEEHHTITPEARATSAFSRFVAPTTTTEKCGPVPGPLILARSTLNPRPSLFF